MGREMYQRGDRVRLYLCLGRLFESTKAKRGKEICAFTRDEKNERKKTYIFTIKASGVISFCFWFVLSMAAQVSLQKHTKDEREAHTTVRETKLGGGKKGGRRGQRQVFRLLLPLA